MKIYPYSMASGSAKLLAEALGIKRIKHQGDPLTLNCNVINWGCSKPTRSLLFTEELLNNFDAVKKAANKLSAFEVLQGVVNIPEWTDDSNWANDCWLGGGHKVVCRTMLNGHSGQGIEIYDPKKMTLDDDGVNFTEFNFMAPLYVKYIEKKEEYRIHVFQDEVIFLQRKARKNDVPDDKVNWEIRNHQNGFIYAHKDVKIDDVAKEQAILAVKTLGLDFGAVDIIWNKEENKYYILEINTAPGIINSSLAAYVEKFKKFQ